MASKSTDKVAVRQAGRGNDPRHHDERQNMRMIRTTTTTTEHYGNTGKTRATTAITAGELADIAPYTGFIAPGSWTIQITDDIGTVTTEHHAISVVELPTASESAACLSDSRDHGDIETPRSGGAYARCEQCHAAMAVDGTGMPNHQKDGTPWTAIQRVALTPGRVNDLAILDYPGAAVERL